MTLDLAFPGVTLRDLEPVPRPRDGEKRPPYSGAFKRARGGRQAA